MIRFLRAVWPFLLALPLYSGCGSGNNPGANLGVLLLPSNVIIGPSAMKTCQDYINASATASGAARAITFPKFRIDWSDQSNFLLISSIRVTITGSGISGGKYVTELSGDELDDLFGGAQLAKNQFVDITHPTPPANPTADPREKSRAGLAACHLTVGSIAIDKGAPSFRATITVDVIGTALSDDYTSQAFVKQTVRATADYYAY